MKSANDVVNPAAENHPGCSIYGMPIVRAYKAAQVVVLKRGMSRGYSVNATRSWNDRTAAYSSAMPGDVRRRYSTNSNASDVDSANLIVSEKNAT